MNVVALHALPFSSLSTLIRLVLVEPPAGLG